MKSNRQKAILELIERHHIETQDELITYLSVEGYNITQATISRDIRQLQLTKMMTSRGTYRYVAPKAEDMVSSPATEPSKPSIEKESTLAATACARPG